MDIREVARQAAMAKCVELVGTPDGVDDVHADALADAVAVAVLHRVTEAMTEKLTPALNTGTAFDLLVIVGQTIRELGAAFTPAEPPQQETKVIRAPTNRADTVADPRGLDLADPMDRHTVYALSSRSSAPDTVEVIASFVEHLRDGYQSTTEPVAKVARLIRERFGKP